MSGNPRGPFIHVSGWSAVARYSILLLILAGTAWAFSARFKSRLTELNTASMVVDELRILTAEERSRLQAIADRYRSDFGLRLRIKISNTDIRPPHVDGQTLFLGASPGGNEAVFVLPPLAKKAVPDLALKEEEKSLMRCMKRQSPGSCLEKTLSALYSYLRD